MKKIIATAFVAGLFTVVAGGTAQAGTDNPKACFGQDRAAGVHSIGGKAWGDEASNRAGDNSSINATYKAGCS